jgi:hypothetical protein
MLTKNPLKEGLPRMIFKDYRRLSASFFRTEIPATGPLKIDTRKIFRRLEEGKD